MGIPHLSPKATRFLKLGTHDFASTAALATINKSVKYCILVFEQRNRKGKKQTMDDENLARNYISSLCIIPSHGKTYQKETDEAELILPEQVLNCG